MKKLIAYASLSIATMFSLNSCSKVSSDDLEDDVPYHQSYSVFFDGSNNSTRGSASFRVRTSNGTGITLDDESSLLVNNNVAAKEPIVSAFVPIYAWEGTTITDITFKLNKKGGTTFTNTMHTNDIDAVTFPANMPSAFSKGSGINFNYVGNPGSTVVIVRGQNTSGADTSVSRNATTNNVTFSSTELNIFATGSVEIEMTRIKAASLQQSDGNAGGEINITYRVHNSYTLNN